MQVDPNVTTIAGSLTNFVLILIAWLNNNKRVGDTEEIVRAEAQQRQGDMRLWMREYFDPKFAEINQRLDALEIRL